MLGARYKSSSATIQGIATASPVAQLCTWHIKARGGVVSAGGRAREDGPLAHLEPLCVWVGGGRSGPLLTQGVVWSRC